MLEGMLLGQRFRVRHRGLFTGRYSLIPAGEYGPLPATGDVLAPAEAVDVGAEALRSIARGDLGPAQAKATAQHALDRLEGRA